MTEDERAKARQRAREWRQRPGNAEREVATKAAFREAHPERWREQRRAATKRYNDAHREALKEKRNTKRAELRAAAIVAYGGRCACPGCHVDHAELLCIDHIDGSGADHRRALGRSTRDFYRWLEKNDYPLGFQLLCGSCNLAKASNAACPLAGQEH